MSDCLECKRKDVAIFMLEKACGEYRIAHHMEMKRSTVLSNALQQIYGMAKDNMWYPCSFKNHEAVDQAQEAGIKADLAAMKPQVES